MAGDAVVRHLRALIDSVARGELGDDRAERAAESAAERPNVIG